jgi:hypothetical protein
LESFDLVIIDEASQSDAWALPAILRGKQILIVGDDKQVSPSNVGVRESDITFLRDRHLGNLPYGHLLLPGASIYALGSVMFASDVVRLREHFRCVEPIIHFSNKAFYDREIFPLRVPKPSERLDPPLVDVFVKSGYRNERKKINKPEARAIVEEIRRLTEDPRFEGRSIGVVSLLGPEQARYIQDLLLAEVGEDIGSCRKYGRGATESTSSSKAWTTGVLGSSWTGISITASTSGKRTSADSGCSNARVGTSGGAGGRAITQTRRGASRISTRRWRRGVSTRSAR